MKKEKEQGVNSTMHVSEQYPGNVQKKITVIWFTVADRKNEYDYHRLKQNGRNNIYKIYSYLFIIVIVSR